MTGTSKPVYYAHSRQIYNTEREHEELGFLRTVFRKVVDPNGDLGNLGSMEAYIKVVETCGTLVLSEYNGYIGRGVFEETKTALKMKIPVHVLRLDSRRYDLIPVMAVEIHNALDWKVTFGTVRDAPAKPTLTERLRMLFRSGPGCRSCHAYPDRCEVLRRKWKTCECRKCRDRWCEFRGDGYNTEQPCLGMK